MPELLSNLVYDRRESSGSPARLSFVYPIDELHIGRPHRPVDGSRVGDAGAGALGASLTELLDTTGSGIIQLDQRGRIVEMNDRARDLLRTGDGLFDARGFLFARTPEDNTHLQGLLTRALPPFGAQGVAGSIIVSRASALPLVLYVNPVNRQETHLRVWPVAALVLVVDPESRTRIDPAMAGAALGLTGTESRVAVLLAEGMSVREIASAMGRKESTIRSHVKHMFAKHGLSRQVELVRLVLSLANAPEYGDRRQKQP